MKAFWAHKGDSRSAACIWAGTLFLQIIPSAPRVLWPVHLGLSGFEYINLNDFEVWKEDLLTKA